MAIGALERYVADWARPHTAELEHVVPDDDRSRTVAVVGSGPAGLTAAGDLAKAGHAVTIFEAFHAPGGVLDLRHPRVPPAQGHRPGRGRPAASVRRRDRTELDHRQDVHARRAARAVRRDLPRASAPACRSFLNVPGENLKGVYSANEYLTRVNLMG